MRINKQQLFDQLVKTKLWKNLSAKELRLYLLLIVTADSECGNGKLTLQEIKHHLELDWCDTNKTIYRLQNLHLVKVNCCGKSDVQFQVFYLPNESIT